MFKSLRNKITGKRDIIQDIINDEVNLSSILGVINNEGESVYGDVTPEFLQTTVESIFRLVNTHRGVSATMVTVASISLEQLFEYGFLDSTQHLYMRILDSRSNEFYVDEQYLIINTLSELVTLSNGKTSIIHKGTGLPLYFEKGSSTQLVLYWSLLGVLRSFEP